MQTYVKLTCFKCQKEFERTKSQYSALKSKNTIEYFCNKNCFISYYQKGCYVKCGNCDKSFYKKLSHIKKTKNNFCSKSCSTTYNNKHKTKGSRRSKLEKWIECKLNNIYPYLNMGYNKKDIILSELDIYIPSLSLAFELNGIFHYKAIFGNEKLEKIVNNDKLKI